MSHRIALERLSDADVDLMVREIAGELPPRTVARIRERSQGIPFFVEELTDCCDRDVTMIPETLKDLMLARLDGLSPQTRDILRIASAAGTLVDHTVLLAVVDSDEQSLEAALREAVGGQVLVVDRTREAYAFRHALMREAVHADLLPGEHARLHARYAQALEKFARPEQAGEIAHHWSSAHEADKSFEWSLRAADHSRSIYAWREQLAHLERAVDLWDQVAAPAERAGFDRAELLSRTSRARGGTWACPIAPIALIDAALADLGPDADPQRVSHLLVKRAIQCECRAAGSLRRSAPGRRAGGPRVGGPGRCAGGHCRADDDRGRPRARAGPGREGRRGRRGVRRRPAAQPRPQHAGMHPVPDRSPRGGAGRTWTWRGISPWPRAQVPSSSATTATTPTSSSVPAASPRPSRWPARAGQPRRTWPVPHAGGVHGGQRG